MEQDNTEELDIREYLTILRRRAWVIVVCAALATSVALGVSLVSQKIYGATAKVLVTDPQNEMVFNDRAAAGGDPARRVQTQIEVITSQPVEQEVRSQLGSRADLIKAVRVSGIGQTDVIRITVESGSRLVARQAANMYAEVYTEQRRDQAVDALLSVGQEVLQRAQDVQKQLDELDTKITRLSSPGKPDSAQVQTLKTQREAAETQYLVLQQKYEQVQVDAALRQGGAQVIEQATGALGPVSPKPVRNALLALVLGTLLGCGLAFALEQLDDTVRAAEALGRLAPGIPVLGHIPAIADWKDRAQTRLIATEDPRSPASEAYRSLRTSIQFIALRQPLRTLMVTSAGAGAGKTTTIANLAVTLARSGKNVVAISCDLRRPRTQSFFQGGAGTGLTSVLLGEAQLQTTLRSYTLAGDNVLRVLDSGPLPPNPSELLGTPSFAELLGDIATGADVVLIDTPPLLPVTDALVLAPQVDGVLLVVTAGITSRRSLNRAIQLLEQANAPVIGVVFNQVSVEEGYGLKYGYEYLPPGRGRKSRRDRNGSGGLLHRRARAKRGV